mgnify:CR=1 FL=1
MGAAASNGALSVETVKNLYQDCNVLVLTLAKEETK